MAESWPGISVVIPTHRRPLEVVRAISSVGTDDYPGHIEIIAVFDGEPARPLPDLKRAKLTIRAVENKGTRGLAGARNAGIAEASHGYIAFLDDDDEWIPGRIADQIEIFFRHPETVLVGGGIVLVTPEGEFPRKCPTVISHRQLLRHRIPAMGSCTFVVRASALRGELGLVDEDLPWGYGEDWDLAIRAAKIAPVRALERPVARVNWMQPSYYADAWQRKVDALEYLKGKHDFASDPKALARVDGLIAYSLAAAGRRTEARAMARSALRHDKTEKRALLSILLGPRLITAERVSAITAKWGYRW